MTSPEAGGGSRPHNLEFSTLKPLPEQSPVGWGVKKLENQEVKQSGIPENKEQWEQRERSVIERARNYYKIAERIMEERASPSSRHDPKELLKVAELLSMKGIGMGEALSIINGKEEALRNEIEEMEEESFPHYRNIVAEFSDENNNR